VRTSVAQVSTAKRPIHSTRWRGRTNLVNSGVPIVVLSAVDTSTILIPMDPHRYRSRRKRRLLGNRVERHQPAEQQQGAPRLVAEDQLESFPQLRQRGRPDESGRTAGLARMPSPINKPESANVPASMTSEDRIRQVRRCRYSPPPLPRRPRRRPGRPGTSSGSPPYQRVALALQDVRSDGGPGRFERWANIVVTNNSATRASNGMRGITIAATRTIRTTSQTTSPNGAAAGPPGRPGTSRQSPRQVPGRVRQGGVQR